MPMPVSVTAIVTHSAAPSSTRRPRSVTVPCSVNLLALLARLSSACRMRVWSACIVPSPAAQSTTSVLPFFAAIVPMVVRHVVDQRRDREGLEVELHLAGFDLGQVEDVVDQREQVPGGAQHALERLELVLALQVAARPRAASR